MATPTDAVIPGDVVQGHRLPLHATLAKRLKKARQGAGLNRAPLSIAAGLAANTVANIERSSIPGPDTVEKLARTLNISPCYLAYGIEGEAPPPLPDDTLRSAGCGARVTQLRGHQGMSLRGLGEAAGLSATAIQNIEADAKPSVATVEALARALSCSPCWLAFGEGTDPLQEPARAATEAAAVKYRPPRKPVAPRRRRPTKTREETRPLRRLTSR